MSSSNANIYIPTMDNEMVNFHFWITELEVMDISIHVSARVPGCTASQLFYKFSTLMKWMLNFIWQLSNLSWAHRLLFYQLICHYIWWWCFNVGFHYFLATMCSFCWYGIMWNYWDSLKLKSQSIAFYQYAVYMLLRMISFFLIHVIVFEQIEW